MKKLVVVLLLALSIIYVGHLVANSGGKTFSQIEEKYGPLRITDTVSIFVQFVDKDGKTHRFMENRLPEGSRFIQID